MAILLKINKNAIFGRTLVKTAKTLSETFFSFHGEKHHGFGPNVPNEGI